MTTERRQEIYSKIFQFMVDNNICSIPFEIEPLCKQIEVDLVPLTEIVAHTGLTAQEIFSIWGNEDGVIHRYQNKHRISYNDNAPHGRKRFTICEELSHMILGHTKDQRFCMCRQDYCAETYAQYEEEGRIGAGLLMCNPKFFYTYENSITPSKLAEICCLTLPCATARMNILSKYKAEIMSNTVYPFLPSPEYHVAI